MNIIYVYLLKQNNSIILSYYWYVTALLGGMWIIFVSVNIDRLPMNKSISFLKYCGTNSMQIYVMHLLPLAGARIILLKIMDLQNLWLIVVIISVISLCSCFIAIYLFNRLRISKYLFGNF